MTYLALICFQQQCQLSLHQCPHEFHYHHQCTFLALIYSPSVGNLATYAMHKSEHKVTQTNADTVSNFWVISCQTNWYCTPHHTTPPQIPLVISSQLVHEELWYSYFLTIFISKFHQDTNFRKFALQQCHDILLICDLLSCNNLRFKRFYMGLTDIFFCIIIICYYHCGATLISPNKKYQN